MGAETKFKVSGFDVYAGYAQTDLARGWNEVITEDNSAIWANIAYERESWGLSAGYKRIFPLYSAPGDWGRIGIWWNPTDIEGFEFGGHAAINPKLSVNGSAEFYTGTNNGALDGVTVDKLGFNSNDKVNRYVVGLDYKCSSSWLFSLGYEWVEWNLKSRTTPSFVGGKPTESWINLGLDYSMTSQTKLSVLWQVSSYNSKGVAGFGPFANGNGDSDRASGGLLTTQLSMKF
jgi:hypothetical protein